MNDSLVARAAVSCTTGAPPPPQRVLDADMLREVVMWLHDECGLGDAAALEAACEALRATVPCVAEIKHTDLARRIRGALDLLDPDGTAEGRWAEAKDPLRSVAAFMKGLGPVAFEVWRYFPRYAETRITDVGLQKQLKELGYDYTLGQLKRALQRLRQFKLLVPPPRCMGWQRRLVPKGKKKKEWCWVYLRQVVGRLRYHNAKDEYVLVGVPDDVRRRVEQATHRGGARRGAGRDRCSGEAWRAECKARYHHQPVPPRPAGGGRGDTQSDLNHPAILNSGDTQSDPRSGSSIRIITHDPSFCFSNKKKDGAPREAAAGATAARASFSEEQKPVHTTASLIEHSTAGAMEHTDAGEIEAAAVHATASSSNVNMGSGQPGVPEIQPAPAKVKMKAVFLPTANAGEYEVVLRPIDAAGEVRENAASECKAYDVGGG